MKALRPILVLALFVLFVFSATPGLAAGGKGTNAVRSANERVRELLRKKVEPGSKAEEKLAAQVTKKLRTFLDIEELGRRALRDHWDELPEAQRTEFMTLLRELIEKNYVKGLRANLDYEVVYVSEQPKGEHLVVTTEIKAERRGRPYKVEVDYVLRKDGSTWRTFDVVTDGVGLVENYRAQFNKIIAKEGMDGLLARMRKKNGGSAG